MKKNKKINIKEILQDKQKRAILILGLYFIFFLFLTISIRSNYKEQAPDTTAEIINNEFAPEKISMDSYSYEYKIMKEGTLNIYKGKKYKNKEQFIFNNNEYFKENEQVFKKNVGNSVDDFTWEEVENPLIYSEYLDFDYLNKILEKSEYNSTTNYKDGLSSISYFMYLDDAITENTMTLTSKDNTLTKIEISIDKDSITIDLTDQNKIEDFNK